MRKSTVFKSDFLKNVFTLSLGTTIAQAIPFFLYPVLARIYSPEDYGLFALYFTIFALFEGISTGRYELAVVLPKEDDDSIALVWGGMIIGTAFSLILLIPLFFVGNHAAIWLNNPSITNWLWTIPFVLLFVNFGKLLTSWLTRKKSFKALSINKISQKVSEVSIALSVGKFSVINGLILGDFFGRLVMLLISSYQSVKAGFGFKNLEKNKIKKNLIKYKEFPIYNALPALMNTASSLFPILIISANYSDTVTGYFNFSRQMLSAPFVLIAASIGQVLFQQIAEKKNNNEPVLRHIFDLFGMLSVLSFIFFIVIVFFAPALFCFAFGEKWQVSGEYAQIMIFSFAVQFAISPLSMIFASLQKIKIASIWQVLYFIIICFLFTLKNIPIKDFLVILATIEVVAYLIYLVLILYVAKQYDKSLRKLK